MPDTRPGDGNARQLKNYWCHGEGLTKWATHPHPWTTLVTLLTKHVGPHQAKGLASTYFREVFGIWPGERKGTNPTGKG